MIHLYGVTFTRDCSALETSSSYTVYWGTINHTSCVWEESSTVICVAGRLLHYSCALGGATPPAKSYLYSVPVRLTTVSVFLGEEKNHSFIRSGHYSVV